jgi:hypothetical protein
MTQSIPRLTSQLLTEHSRKAIMIYVERKEDRRQMTNATIGCLVERDRKTSYICVYCTENKHINPNIFPTELVKVDLCTPRSLPLYTT